MDIKPSIENASTLQSELLWLANIIDARFKIYWQQEGAMTDIFEIQPPDLSNNTSMYAQVVKHYKMSVEERMILLLSLAPHIQPHLLDVFYVKNANYDRGFTEFGGVKGQNHSGFIPTGETAAFILAADSLEKRFALLEIFGEDHYFNKHKILKLSSTHADEPYLSGVLTLSVEYLNYFTNGSSHKPDYNVNFPAKRISTRLDWDDLVLQDDTLEEVMEIRDWIQYGGHLLNDWGMSNKIKPGFRSLFYGPPGTGKTLTASLLGKSSALDVYRIDLSMVVSKYIGETEKNLGNIFDQAENKNWILFFDEADALFGKRTQTSSSNDRHANQEVSYLLQRVEDFPGVVILATNLKANLDEAFTRRFQSMIYFPMPGPEHRKKLWEQAFSEQTILDAGVNLDEVAQKYEMAGGAIINVTRYASLMALKRSSNVILMKDIITGIRKEFGKEGKTV
ncbi:ATP-binding protein [Sediminibacterium goheungense]|uniref:ATPase family protein associated with various cellular activities (AAA) n=1 Tax=Sediminibacterium goheungense TaxID=1086393 RepID=A0A4R6IT62_9BACT|nr:ATP-binding protein [Sediminibacterium goheungense]TDO25683.1 ATPase family protein associated with various cellular activities (AAA) [Sediminibacterium goheungense]